MYTKNYNVAYMQVNGFIAKLNICISILSLKFFRPIRTTVSSIFNEVA